MPDYISIPLFILLILGIAYGYYLDYKQDKKSISGGLKTGLMVISCFVAFNVLGFLYKYYIPVYQNYAQEFNEIRIARGIPPIGDDWEIQPWRSDHFKKWYAHPKAYAITGRGYKVVGFNYWKAVYEEDLYRNPNSSTGLIARFRYARNRFEYFLIQPITLASEVKSFPDEFVPDFIEQERIPITRERFDQILNSWTKDDALLEKEENE
ncbi:MAG: hypothetical protein Roseis2KO_03210 [Roseivirga sp.]